MVRYQTTKNSPAVTRWLSIFFIVIGIITDIKLSFVLFSFGCIIHAVFGFDIFISISSELIFSIKLISIK